MNEILKYIEEKNSISTPELAAKCQVSPDMLQAKLEQYVRLGYLKRVVMDENACDGNCKKCKGCSGAKKPAEPVTFWEKGELWHT